MEIINQKMYLTKPELAKHLQISVRQLEKLVDARKIPITRLGRRCVRFNIQSVNQALGLLEVQAVRKNTPHPTFNKKNQPAG